MTSGDNDRLTDIPGVAVGNWTNVNALTGCTVVLPPPGTVGSCEVRGGAPASRELALLDPNRLVDNVDAIILTGGSAFGLATADGVMAWLEERGRGWPTPAGPVPIVPVLALFDLAVGDPSVRPGSDEGRAACDSAQLDSHDVGPVGAGTGCTIDKWRGMEHVRPGGLVAATERLEDVVVSVLVAVNAWGGVGNDTVGIAQVLGTRTESFTLERPMANTTIGVVMTNARLDKVSCALLSQAAHDGLARAVFPSHSHSDGDAFIAGATGESEADVDELRALTTAAVERAIRGLQGDFVTDRAPDRRAML